MFLKGMNKVEKIVPLVDYALWLALQKPSQLMQLKEKEVKKTYTEKRSMPQNMNNYTAPPALPPAEPSEATPPADAPEAAAEAPGGGA